jgi:hypothetical protein
MVRCLVLLLASTLCACSDRAYVGSDLFWFSESEGADSAEWSADAGGGAFEGFAGSSVELSAERAHRGNQAFHFVTPAAGEDSGAILYRNIAVPSEGYYSAWFLVPALYVTRSYFVIMKFHSRDPDDPELYDKGIDIRLRDLNSGEFMLHLVHHHPDFLQSPLPLPPPIVTPDRWFHVEAFLRAAPDGTGMIKLWLDGRLIYDLPERPTVDRDVAYFSVCSMSKDAEPPSVELYVDDIAVSRTRVTETGILTE